MNQVAEDTQLLGIAEDGFRFVTKFFDVINVSAAHIYHSALELCPVSSMFRKLYYHRRIDRSPKVVVGIPDSWDRTIAAHRKDHYYKLCTWSPCGRFVAAQTTKAVEIRNQLTLEPITILQRTETVPYLTGPLAYSPDGRSIACASDAAIIIWDIQTGGVAKEIKCNADNMSLVWSSDGGTLCTIDSEDQVTFAVRMYAVSSGTTSFLGTFQSGDNPHLWADNESFWVMMTVGNGHPIGSIDILRVGSTLTKIQSFSPRLPNAKIGSFSPATHRISISTNLTLRILDIRGSGNYLLDRTGRFLSHCFSSDGSLFAASLEDAIHIWKYDSGHYTPRWELRCRGSNFPQFSPTMSSILSHSRDILQVWHLHDPPTTSETYRQHCVGLSRSGTRVATANRWESTITITDTLAQTPPQFIDTNMAIDGLVLTGNVLLVAGLGELVAWLLTEEGLVDGAIGVRRVGRSDSIWTMPQSKHAWAFRVKGQVGIIAQNGVISHVYHTETGEVLHPTRAPPPCNHGWHLTDTFCGRDYLRYYDFSQHNIPPKDRWQTSRSTLREGWVKDSEGKRRLWVPVEWRGDWDPQDWCHDITTQFSHLEGRAVLIKF